MKIVSSILLFVFLGVVVNAQDAKVVTEIAARAETTMVKNSPFSADAISESVQTLADGNRIVRSSTSKLYRNSEGRFRREMASGSGGALGSLYTYGQGVTLFDPVGGYRYMIDPNLKTTRQVVIHPKHDIKIVTGTGGAVDTAKLREEIKAAAAAGTNVRVINEQLREEIKAAVAAAPVAAAKAVTGQVLTEALTGVGMTYAIGTTGQNKWDTRTEELGVQNIEGVDAEGTRTITTIPAGGIGNERPIEITYEKWYSRELQLVVMSKHNDPRFGEQTYRLTNIVRSEPDPSLFTLPNGYKLITEPASGVYTINAAKAIYAEKAAAAKSGQSGTAVTKTKP